MGPDPWPSAINDLLASGRPAQPGDVQEYVHSGMASAENTIQRGTAASRLPRPDSGLPMRNVRAVPDRDYPADTSLVYERGGHDFVTRLTPADVTAVIAALAPSMPTAGELVTAFLAGRLEQARREFGPAGGEIGPGPEVRALERVIKMLGGS